MVSRTAHAVSGPAQRTAAQANASSAAREVNRQGTSVKGECVRLRRACQIGTER